MEVYNKCASYSDLVAGSPEEEDFLKWFVSYLDSPAVWFHLSPVEVLYWKDLGATLEVEGGEVAGLAMPYSKSAFVEGRLVPLDGDVEGNIVVAKFPEDVDDAKYIVIEAAERGAVAVVFSGSPPRRIVVTEERGFKLDASPTPIPTASFEDVLKYLGRRARLKLETEARITYGYNLIAFNSFDNTPMISAHFDHWLIGASDNCAGVQAAVLAFGELVANDVPIALGLFTAEEGVAPHVPSLYWAWGSYVYFRRWKPTFLVNIDVAGVGTPRIYAIPYLHDLLRGLGPVENPAAYFDSLHYERWGLPSVTISSLKDTWGIYHSRLDAHVDREGILYVAELAKRIAKIKPPIPAADFSELGLATPDDPYRAWSSVYNYLVVFRDYRHSDIVYTNVFQFLKSRGGEYRRIDLLGGPTLCVNNCGDAIHVYRELVALEL